MGTLIKGLLSGVWGYVAVAVVAGTLTASASGYAVHVVELAKYEALQLKDAKAATTVAEETTKAVTAEKDAEIAQVEDVRDAAIAEAARQPVLVQKVKEVETQIPVFITPAVNARTCIPNGFVELLNSAAASYRTDGEAPPALSSGQSNDSCTASDVSELAGQIIERIIKPAEQNAEQLDALEAAVKKQIDDFNRGSSVTVAQGPPNPLVEVQILSPAATNQPVSSE